MAIVYRLLFLLILVLFTNGCKENKSLSDSSTIKNEGTSLKVNASKKDLAEIMLLQDYWKDTVSLSRDVYTRLLFIKSDGSISKNIELDPDEDYRYSRFTTNGLNWVYTADITKNVAVNNHYEKSIKKIFDGTEDVRFPNGDKNRFTIFIDDVVTYKNEVVFIATDYSLTRYDIKNKSKIFINSMNNSSFWPLAKSSFECYYFGFLPNSKDDEVEGKQKRAIYKYDFKIKKESLIKVFPFKFSAEERAISENGEVAVFEMENRKEDDDGWEVFINDSLYFYLNNFTDSFKIAVFENLHLLHLGPNGRWIYYRCENVIYRIELDRLRKQSEWRKNDLIQNSECVYIQDRFTKSFKIQNISSINE